MFYFKRQIIQIKQPDKTIIDLETVIFYLKSILLIYKSNSYLFNPIPSLTSIDSSVNVSLLDYLKKNYK